MEDHSKNPISVESHILSDLLYIAGYYVEVSIRWFLQRFRGMIMVHTQRLVLAIGTVLAVAAGLFPPWNFVVVIPNSGGAIKRAAGYAPLFSPPAIKVVEGVKIEPVINGTQREKVLNDPKFFALPEDDQISVLSHFDPEFGRLAPIHQRQILQMHEDTFRLKRTNTPDVEPTTGWPPNLINVEINGSSLLVRWETPRLCRGGSESLTAPAVHCTLIYRAAGRRMR